ncbi:MAG: hypothetical protein HOO06_07345 [Bdellovibrionaceae bacterium]|jgi:hypothetical protein|nr:hypothetical protein [Pseudobdellovibrionaceae bacterium]
MKLLGISIGLLICASSAWAMKFKSISNGKEIVMKTFEVTDWHNLCDLRRVATHESSTYGPHLDFLLGGKDRGGVLYACSIDIFGYSESAGFVPVRVNGGKDAPFTIGDGKTGKQVELLVSFRVQNSQLYFIVHGGNEVITNLKDTFKLHRKSVPLFLKRYVTNTDIKGVSQILKFSLDALGPKDECTTATRRTLCIP